MIFNSKLLHFPYRCLEVWWGALGGFGLSYELGASVALSRQEPWILNDLKAQENPIQ